MSRTALIQAVLIIACIGLTAFLYFSPKTMLTPNSFKAVFGSNAASNTDIILERAKSKLERQEVTSINELEKILRTKTGSDRLTLLDSLAWRWDILNEPAAAAEYYKKMAEMNTTEKSWSDAATRYLAALRIENDSATGAWLLEQAIQCSR